MINVLVSMGILMLAFPLTHVLAGENPVKIMGFSFSSERERTRLFLDTQHPIKKYKYFTLIGPRRLVVDVYNSRLGLKKTTFKVDDQFVHRVRFGIHTSGKVRMVVDLKMPVQYQIFVSEPSPGDHRGLMVGLTNPERTGVHSQNTTELDPQPPQQVKGKKADKEKYPAEAEVSETNGERPSHRPVAASEHLTGAGTEEPLDHPRPSSFQNKAMEPSSAEDDEPLFREAQENDEMEAEDFSPIQNLIKEGKYREALDRLIRSREDGKGGDKEFVLFAIAECLYRLGLESGDYLEAIEAYQMAYLSFPNSKMAHEALFRIVKAYSEMKLIHEAHSNLRELLERYPDSEYIPEALHLMGINFFQASKFKEASACFEQLVNRYPDHEKFREAIFKLGSSLEAAGEIKKAKIIYNRALSKFPEMADLPADIGFSIVRTYFKTRDAETFKKVAFQAVNLFTDSSSQIDALHQIANFYALEGNPDQAISTLLNALYEAQDDEQREVLLFAISNLWRRYPERDSPISALMEGNCLSPRDIYVEYARVLPENTDREEVFFRAGKMAMDVGDFRQAIRFFEKPLGFSQKGPFAEKLHNSLIEAFSHLVENDYRAGRYDEVLKVHLGALTEDKKIPLKATTLFQIGESYRRIGLKEYAVPIFREAFKLASDSELKAEIFRALGEIYIVQKQWDEFIDAFTDLSREGTTIANLDVRSVEILGEALFRKGDFDREIQLLAPISSRLSPMGKFWLARAFHERGNVEEAERLYRQNIQWIQIHGENSHASLLDECRLRLGDLFFQSGRLADAKAEYQHLIDRSRSNPNSLWSLYRMILIGLREGDGKKAEDLLVKLSTESNDPLWPSAASAQIKIEAIQRGKGFVQ
ncbi:MAG: tetratricopeptide repeat protein [Deltaproteobacteria bacterium]|nr:tetratricopeptide repeat protein [Deltaproteobacteria bacterium]